MLKEIFCAALIVFLLISFKVEAAEVGADWNNLVITAKGQGVAAAEFRGAQARAMARRAAVVSAYRQLAEIINGVRVNSETTIENMILTSDVIKTGVTAVIRGAQIIDERETESGIYEVTLQVPMFSVNGSLAEAVIERSQEILPFPEPSISVESQQGGVSNYTVLDGGEDSPMAAQGNYTGLIVDCRGLDLNPVMSPVIKNSDGAKLYGHENLNYDLVVSEGMVSYAENLTQAKRAGTNPLIIRAENLADNNSNPVVAVDDGNRILIENGATGFLNDTAVVFLR